MTTIIRVPVTNAGQGIYVPNQSDGILSWNWLSDDEATAKKNFADGVDGTVLGTPSYGAGYADLGAGAGIQTNITDRANVQFGLIMQKGAAAVSTFVLGAREASAPLSGIYLTNAGKVRVAASDASNAQVTCDSVTLDMDDGTLTEYRIFFGTILDDPDGSGDGLLHFYDPATGETVTQSFTGPRKIVPGNYTIGRSSHNALNAANRLSWAMVREPVLTGGGAVDTDALDALATFVLGRLQARSGIVGVS